VGEWPAAEAAGAELVVADRVGEDREAVGRELVANAVEEPVGGGVERPVSVQHPGFLSFV